MKLCEFSEWKCMFEYIIFFLIFLKKECIYECIKLDFFLFYYFWRMHIWMHGIWFSFILLFLKNTYMNACNSIFFCFVIFEECIYESWNLIFFCFVIFEECIYECMKFNFFFTLLFLKNGYMNAWNSIFEECMLKCMKFCVFIIFLFWMKMHVWMLDILFLIFLDDNAYIKWMKFYFSFFIFLNDNAWNSSFLNNHFRC